jgi:cobalamin biosynthesis protein CobD/CbiB
MEPKSFFQEVLTERKLALDALREVDAAMRLDELVDRDCYSLRARHTVREVIETLTKSEQQ